MVFRTPPARALHVPREAAIPHGSLGITRRPAQAHGCWLLGLPCSDKCQAHGLDCCPVLPPLQRPSPPAPWAWQAHPEPRAIPQGENIGEHQGVPNDFIINRNKTPTWWLKPCPGGREHLSEGPGPSAQLGGQSSGRVPCPAKCTGEPEVPRIKTGVHPQGGQPPAGLPAHTAHTSGRSHTTLSSSRSVLPPTPRHPAPSSPPCTEWLLRAQAPPRRRA